MLTFFRPAVAEAEAVILTGPTMVPDGEEKEPDALGFWTSMVRLTSCPPAPSSSKLAHQIVLMPAVENVKVAVALVPPVPKPESYGLASVRLESCAVHSIFTLSPSGSVPRVTLMLTDTPLVAEPGELLIVGVEGARFAVTLIVRWAVGPPAPYSSKLVHQIVLVPVAENVKVAVAPVPAVPNPESYGLASVRLES